MKQSISQSDSNVFYKITIWGNSNFRESWFVYLDMLYYRRCNNFV